MYYFNNELNLASFKEFMVSIVSFYELCLVCQTFVNKIFVKQTMFLVIGNKIGMQLHESVLCNDKNTLLSS